jgi:hypothetical protein
MTSRTSGRSASWPSTSARLTRARTRKGNERFKEESHHLFDLIVQDVGSDLGFVYATGIGQGSMVAKEKLDCPALLKEWEEIREDYDLKGDG